MIGQLCRALSSGRCGSASFLGDPSPRERDVFLLVSLRDDRKRGPLEKRHPHMHIYIYTHTCIYIYIYIYIYRHIIHMVHVLSFLFLSGSDFKVHPLPTNTGPTFWLGPDPRGEVRRFPGDVLSLGPHRRSQVSKRMVLKCSFWSSQFGFVAQKGPKRFMFRVFSTFPSLGQFGLQFVVLAPTGDNLSCPGPSRASEEQDLWKSYPGCLGSGFGGMSRKCPCAAYKPPLVIQRRLIILFKSRLMWIQTVSLFFPSSNFSRGSFRSPGSFSGFSF